MCLYIVCRSCTLLKCLDIFAYFIFLELAWFLTLLFSRWFTVLIQSIYVISLKRLPSLLQFETHIIHAVLIPICSNGQALSIWSMLIIRDSVFNSYLWLVHCFQGLCLDTRVSCSSLASSWPMRPTVWGLNKSMTPYLLESASIMLWWGTKINFYSFDFYIYI